jgi:hypothetical protein
MSPLSLSHSGRAWPWDTMGEFEETRSSRPSTATDSDCPERRPQASDSSLTDLRPPCVLTMSK